MLSQTVIAAPYIYDDCMTHGTYWVPKFQKIVDRKKLKFQSTCKTRMI